jgi:hypothetical protein
MDIFDESKHRRSVKLSRRHFHDPLLARHGQMAPEAPYRAHSGVCERGWGGLFRMPLPLVEYP